jgi:hypothetical protein
MGKGIGKKLLYSLASRSLDGEFKRINEQYRRERQQINSQWQRQAWADWLQRKAREGNADALKALRARGRGSPLLDDYTRRTFSRKTLSKHLPTQPPNRNL